MMNDDLDTNALKIALYLEDGMSPEEEVAFMEEVGRDEVLRKSFEEALLVREVLGAYGGVAGASGVVAAAPAAAPARVLSLFWVRAIAAACVAVVLIVFGIARSSMFEPHYADPGEYVGPSPDEASRLDRDNAAQVAAASTRDSLFSAFYSAYVGEKDPVEISLYYQHYRDGDYAPVLAAREDDYQLMGTGTKMTILNQYMRLYRGLSFLADRRPERALGQFDSLLNSRLTGKDVYYSAQWYALLSVLQRKDITADSALTAASLGARAIVGQTASPYREKAARLSGLLSDRRP